MKKMKRILTIITIAAVVLGSTAINSPSLTLKNNASISSNKGNTGWVTIRT